MNGLKIAIISVTILLITTGCFSKTLECTMNDDDFGNQTMELKYDSSGENLETFEMTLEEEFDSEDEANEAVNEGICSMITGESVTGVVCEAESKGKSVVMTVTYDVSELSDEMIKELELEGMTYDNAKSEAEKDGYTCN